MAQKLHLALLVCDTPTPEVLEKYGDYPRMFTRIFEQASKDRNVEITWEYFDVVHKQEYPDLRDLADNKTFDAVVITGSAASAYKDDPWIVKLVEYVCMLRSDPYKANVRLVGICFGHQIIARACGGHCEKNPNGWEFGLESVYLTALGKEFFRTEKGFIRVHQIHQDHVKELPAGFHSLATTAPHTPIHALVSDDSQCITIQGHPEYRRDAARILLRVRRDAGLVPEDYANLQLEKLDRESDSADDDVWLVGKFVDFILGQLPLQTKDRVSPDTGAAQGPNVRIGND